MSLHDLFVYDEESGILFNKKDRGSKIKKGAEAGFINKSLGYRLVYVDGKSCYSHRVIWELAVGKIPDGDCVRHKDGDTLNNRLSNLYLQSNRENVLSERRATVGYDSFSRAFSYDPLTGAITRKDGSECVKYDESKGYYNIYYKCLKWKAHRVAWLLHYGEFPCGQIDHINGNRKDNRICNLRDVNQSGNSKNTAISKRNTSGHIGVHRTKYGKWCAMICVNGKNKSLGNYDNIDLAVEARKKAEAIYGFHENHGRKEQWRTQ